MPFFSVVMPAYNYARYLPEAIESIIAQKFTDWELIVVNDGSTDETPAIIDGFCRRDARIRGIHQQNQGAAAARNRGIARARSSWICYLDSDDVWFPETLERYHAFIGRHPESEFIYGYRHRLDQNGHVHHSAGEHQGHATGARELFLDCYLSPVRVCHRASLLRQVGGYDESLPLCEDYDLFLRMSMHTRFDPINAATGLRRRHDANLSRQTGFSLLMEGRVLQRFLGAYGGGRVIDDATADRRLGHVFYAAGREYFRARDYQRALKSFQLASGHGIPLKGRALQAASRLLSKWSTTNARPWPLPLKAPVWTIQEPGRLRDSA